HRYAIETAAAAYDVLASDQSSLGIMLVYPSRPNVVPSYVGETLTRSVTVSDRAKPAGGGIGDPPTVAFLGAGNYARSLLMPAFKAAGARLKVVASRGGVTATHSARKFGFEESTTDIARVL